MASFVRILVLIWADILAAYAMWVMMTYLTDVWKLGFTHAAGIVNIWGGVALALPIIFAFFVDTVLGNYPMLLFSSIAYTIGLGFLSMSTPTVLSKATGTCSDYKPDCIGHTQKALFYSSMALTALGISGHIVSLGSFLETQRNQEGEEDDNEAAKAPFRLLGALAIVIVPIVGGIALPYIKPWSIHFGIPAICTLVATLLFLSGSCSYRYDKPEGSPITKVFRVFVASTSKMGWKLGDGDNLYTNDDGATPVYRIRGLRCLDKAALILSRSSREEQEKNKWKLCSVTEVEETKIVVRMVPVWMTFIICGLVTSTGNTYFQEQAKNMNRNVGKLKVPLPIFLILYEVAKNSLYAPLYTKLRSCLGLAGDKRYAPPIGIAFAMIFSVLCCITAAKVELRRIDVIRSHNLLDKPDDNIPMTIFWLLPQYLLLSGLDSILESSVKDFFDDQSPPSMRTYLTYFTYGVTGLGIMSSVLAVYVVGKISEKGGSKNWFQYSLNQSRLDRYYWTLAGLSAVNLVLYIVAAVLYPYREPELENEEELDTGPSDDSAEGCCCCCCF